MALLLAHGPTMAQEVEPAAQPATEISVPDPSTARGTLVDMNFVDADLLGLVRYIARATGQNFVLSDTAALVGKKVTLLAPRPMPLDAAYEAFLSALEVHGLTVVRAGELVKIVPAGEAQQRPGTVYGPEALPATDQYVTAMVPLEHLKVADVRPAVDALASTDAKVLAYAPANVLILTDSGHDVRRILDVIAGLDVSAPDTSLRLYPLVYADAAEVADLVEELYGTKASAAAAGRRVDTSVPTRAPGGGDRPVPAAAATPSGITTGQLAKSVVRVLSDERTNTLLVLADAAGHGAIEDLLLGIDVDVDPMHRARVFVHHLEHARADDVLGVLEDLASDRSTSRSPARPGNPLMPNARAAEQRGQARSSAQPAAPEDEDASTGAIAAVESAHFASDPNTNSLLIVASPEDERIIGSLLDQLDIRRRQVFVECVVLELAQTDSTSLNLGYHLPVPSSDGGTGIAGVQLGASSLGLDQDLLSGAALGIYGKSIDVQVTDSNGQVSTQSIPSFGVALQAIKNMQMVDIVSTPSVLSLDNEQAKIVVGRKIPFPTSSGLNAQGQAVVSYQREDVAISLDLTPRVNSEDIVTLELEVKVQDVEDTASSTVSQSGYTTSNREVKTVALVGDNETVVIGGLVASTISVGETKVPVLGDLPVLGALFRNRSKSARRTNLMVFLTPHIIDDDDDVAEIMRVKEAQAQEFERRFYGKSQDEQLAEVRRLLRFSMNSVDTGSVYREDTTSVSGLEAAAPSPRDEVDRSITTSAVFPSR